MDSTHSSANSQDSANTKGIVCIEVHLSSTADDFTRLDQLRDQVEVFVQAHYPSLLVPSELENWQSELDCAHKIVSIFAADYDGPDTGVGVHSPHINRLEILIYRPDGQGWSYSGSVTTIDDSSPTDPGAVYPFGTLTLPNDLLVGADRALVFDNADTMPKAVKTFAGLIEMSLIMSKKEMKYNGLGLAWGPPGGGKTSFCKALSQKLAIRLSKLFTKSLLIEVNCHAVMSKWFGESVLRLQKIFDHVIAMAEEDGGNNLVCVLFDEVETLARSRGLTGDVADAMRVTNHFLTALERLGEYANVVTMATSNLRCVLDAAFLDRVDYPLHIPLPGPRATYEILASCYNAMLEKGVIHFPPLCKEHYEVNCLACTDLLDRRFPNVSGAHVLFWRKSSAPQNILWRLAEECGLSGRNLRLLPYKAIASYTYVKPVSVHSALDALKRQIEEEKRMNVS